MDINEIKELIADHKKFKLEKDADLIDYLTWEKSDKENFYGLDFEYIENDITDTSRWSVCHRVVLKINNRLYMTFYSRGATECQDESPYEYDDNVEFLPAEEYTTIDYKLRNK